MNDILTTILTSGITTAGILALYRHFLSRNIEAFKSNLLFDSQRKVHDFQLFTTKKHETYPRLYGLLYKSTDSILNVTSWFQEYPSFVEYSKTDLENYLSKHELLEVDKNRILSLWETDKQKMQKELHTLIQNEKFYEADQLRIDAYRLFSESLLYQSEDVKKIGEEIVKKQRELLLDHDWYRQEVEPKERKEIRNKIKVHKDTLDKLRKELLETMKTELTVGYYEETQMKSTT
ncbi:hypothetical protein [Jeotgalibacillus haloalkalitolerans]|uniref:DNA helicase n=1 Tax=Jeotgalibacillus haloalkalitolerans TaxID=3104292 RepID=A0ABU5KPB2_9BACL|nr:hypothetical protein [Jeotgalibacillus sp. HH7-29]MDZ5712796.1 hypothetical protein [Jeotgalibacillus sp. HH7-29]